MPEIIFIVAQVPIDNRRHDDIIFCLNLSGALGQTFSERPGIFRKGRNPVDTEVSPCPFARTILFLESYVLDLIKVQNNLNAEVTDVLDDAFQSDVNADDEVNILDIVFVRNHLDQRDPIPLHAECAGESIETYEAEPTVEFPIDSDLAGDTVVTFSLQGWHTDELAWLAECLTCTGCVGLSRTGRHTGDIAVVINGKDGYLAVNHWDALNGRHGGSHSGSNFREDAPAAGEKRWKSLRQRLRARSHSTDAVRILRQCSLNRLAEAGPTHLSSNRGGA